ncbi:winged helix-turn-helix domain-containing protein [Aeromonas cavernicola]|uniref:Winged helix family transcriptional regulator n=1 Tax=Aeromonas cavernicola TaxID=1006623 RepID=A0A2H9U6I2_9GAMM|nr:winged helix-turn-helix domain-containing protein [Aeromonas cavernicola]PJG59645.1 winged helix family transcriptional regulator [Aeromonas cavernicola]
MSSKTYKIAGDIFFSAAIFRLSKGQKDIKLSNKEAELLELLCNDAGTVITRGILLNALWPNQDNTDTNLNRQILSLRRKFESLGLLEAIDTIPRVGYIFCAPIETITDECPVATINNEENKIVTDQLDDTKKYTRRKYDHYLSKRKVLIVALSVILLVFFTLLGYSLVERDEIKMINVDNVSFYINRNSEKKLNLETRKIIPVIKEINSSNRHISIFVGQEAISYLTIDQKNKKISTNVFLLRSGHPILEELQCVIMSMENPGDKITNNYDKRDTTVRYHSNCRTTDQWVDMTQQNNILTTMDREIIVTKFIAKDSSGNTLFDIDSFGYAKRENNKFIVDMNNNIVNFIGQQALINNKIATTLIAALIPPKQKSIFTRLKKGVQMSNYIGGIIIWPGKEFLNVSQKNI